MSSTFKSIIIAATLAGASLVAAEANAMPAPAVAGVSAPIEQAGWRCGPGWHANGWGRCVPNRRPWGPHPRYRRW